MISYGSSSVIIRTDNNTVIKRYHNFSEIFENNIPKREVEILKKINKNNNIIKLISYKENNKKIYELELEYCKLGCLYENYKNMTWKSKLCYSSQIINGLNYIHNNNIIHGDLNSGNIVINEYGIIKIIDFGGSKFGYEDIKTMDTIFYSSPEQIKSGKCYFKSDIYSYGIILLEMIYEKRLFSDYEIENVIEIIENNKILEVYNINFHKTPIMYKYILKKCLQEKLKNRFTTHKCKIHINICKSINLQN